MRDIAASRQAAALRRVTESPDDGGDDGLAAWCLAMGLTAQGTPLPPMEAASRAHEQTLRDERAQAAQPKYRTPFWRLPFTYDI